MGGALYDVRICSLAPDVKSEHVTLRVPWRLSSLSRADTVIVPGIADLDQPIPERPSARDSPGGRSRRARRLHLQRRVRPGRDRGARWPAGDDPLARRGGAGAPLPGDRRRCRRALCRQRQCADVGRRGGRSRSVPSPRATRSRRRGGRRSRASRGDAARACRRAGAVHRSRATAGDHTSIGQLLTWIEQNLRRDLSLPVIARRAAMSTRTLSRRFREQVGATPANWIAARACPACATAARNDGASRSRGSPQRRDSDRRPCCASTSARLSEPPRSPTGERLVSERNSSRHEAALSTRARFPSPRYY